MTYVRSWASVTGALVMLLAAVLLALALSASPASAFTEWRHNGAAGCVCHNSGTPTDASCVTCHADFKSYPDETCWSCHYPGQDTRPYWSTSPTPTPTESPSVTPTPTPTETASACSQECHLWNSAQKAYVIPFTHGTNPHLGATADCLDCHQISPGIADPGSSPHHSGQKTGFTDCAACHSGLQQHAGKVQCTQCHTSAEEFHLYSASSPGFKNCRSCHAMRHAGKKVANRKCAACHRGSSGLPAQHSKPVTKKFVCGGCHSQKRHASAVSKSVKSCRTCHRGKYHAAQRTPPKSACTRCHTVALRHDDGYQCSLCHRRAIHNRRPSAIN